MLMERTEYSISKKLLSVIGNSCPETYSLFVTTSERIELARVCIDIRFLFDWNFQFKDFYEAITSYHYPPLEFLWILNILQIMPLEAYIFNIHTEKENLLKFKESVHRLYIQDFEENDAHYLVQIGVFSYFATKAFPMADTSNWNERINEICLETFKSLLEDIFSTSESELNPKKFSCFFSLWNAGILEEESFLNFCSFALDCYLNLLPSKNELDAFEILERSCSTHSPYPLLILVEKLLKPQKSGRIFQILTSAVQKTEINAASLIAVVRAFLKTHKEASVLLCKLVSELMSEAYDKFSHNMLLRSLLIGRQSTYQPNLPSHIYYKQWLQGVFNKCSCSKNSQSFYLLIQVLSDIVPHHKTIECLKAAIEMNVSVPHEVQNIYTDYIILLKTRVQDLKPQSKPVETVEKVLSLFESLCKIPPVIMETSLLQKHKFLNEFLPALLVPRMEPQIPDVKERFIEALNKEHAAEVQEWVSTGTTEISCREKKIGETGYFVNFLPNYADETRPGTQIEWNKIIYRILYQYSD